MISSKLRILCVLFKPVRIPNIPYLLPVQGGAAVSDWDSGYAKDNTGENISTRNATHSELTSLYWAWKNNVFADSEFVGLCHYRRYFLAQKPLFSRTGFYRYKQITPAFERNASKLPATVAKLFRSVDIITTKPFSARNEKGKLSLIDQYAYYHHVEDWDLLQDTIREICPAYLPSFMQYEQQGYFFQFNMFIAKKQLFDEYMHWMMKIIEHLEQVLPPRQDPYQSRAIAFLSERLLGLYIHHHHLKNTWLPVGYLEDA